MYNWKWFSTLLSCLILFGITNTGFAQPSNYIEKYQKIAIREMHRSGIPASITLAQGILESSWGNGSLALKANNHFGIKCKTHWTGPSFYIEDDDYKRGKLIKSCFRAYENAEESYIDHTDFLMSNPRYQVLFTYDKTDYKRWAHGLKKCGYATDKKYAYKLIRNIEKYGLERFDAMPEEMPAMIASQNAPALNQVVVQNNTPPSYSRNQLQPIRQRPSQPQPAATPQVFALPDNYRRGDGLRKFGTKGNEILKNSASILWNK